MIHHMDIVVENPSKQSIHETKFHYKLIYMCADLKIRALKETVNKTFS